MWNVLKLLVYYLKERNGCLIVEVYNTSVVRQHFRQTFLLYDIKVNVTIFVGKKVLAKVINRQRSSKNIRQYKSYMNVGSFTEKLFRKRIQSNYLLIKNGIEQWRLWIHQRRGKRKMRIGIMRRTWFFGSDSSNYRIAVNIICDPN